MHRQTSTMTAQDSHSRRLNSTTSSRSRPIGPPPEAEPGRLNGSIELSALTGSNSAGKPSGRFSGRERQPAVRSVTSQQERRRPTRALQMLPKFVSQYFVMGGSKPRNPHWRPSEQARRVLRLDSPTNQPVQTHSCQMQDVGRNQQPNPNE